jgi:hypothetical protein
MNAEVNRRTALAMLASGPVLNATPAYAATSPRYAVADVSNDISTDLENATERFKIYRGLGFDMIRTGVGWGDFEAEKGKWQFSPARQRYLELAAQTGLKLKLEVGAWSSAPDWLTEQTPDARILDSEGHWPRPLLSPWWPDARKLVDDAQSRIILDLFKNGVLANCGAVIASLGAGGEPAYPAAWTMPGEQNDSFWFYGPTAEFSFQQAQKVKYKSNLTTANRIWSTNYNDWSDIQISDSARQGKQFWSDVLDWYRDSKRNFVESTLKSLLYSLRPQADALPVVMLIPGSHLTQAELEYSTFENSDGALKLMIDTDFMLTLAHNLEIDVQCTSAQNSAEVAYIGRFIDMLGGTTKLWLENAGGDPGKDTDELALSASRRPYRGYDYINAGMFLTPEGLLKEPMTQNIGMMIEKLKAQRHS